MSINADWFITTKPNFKSLNLASTSEIIDYQTADEQIYHCGASSKDGGNKVTTITAVTDGAIYHPVIDQLVQNPVLTLR